MNELGEYKQDEVFEDVSETENLIPTPRAKVTAMFSRFFGFVESVVSKTADLIMQLSSNTLLKSLGVVAFDVLSEIFIYVVLGICCVFITVIIQTGQQYIQNKNSDDKPSEDS